MKPTLTLTVAYLLLRSASQAVSLRTALTARNRQRGIINNQL